MTKAYCHLMQVIVFIGMFAFAIFAGMAILAIVSLFL